MPIAPYDPTAEDDRDEDILDINDLINRILHNGAQPQVESRRVAGSSS